MPQLIGVLVFIAAYIAFCWAALQFVLVPAWPWTVALAVVVGVLLVVGLLAAGLIGVGPFAAPNVTSADARTRLPAVSNPRGRDDAYANYLFLQSRDDLLTAARGTWTVVVYVWAVAVKATLEMPLLLLAWPLLLLPLTGLVVGTLAAASATVVVYGAVLVVLGVAWLLWAAAAGVLRAGDLGIRTLRRAKATCPYPGCNQSTLLPGYRCTCGAVTHFDIRSGRQGLFLRRCRCGRVLPTTVLKAAAGLIAVCPKCTRNLHAGAAAITDVTVPVIGPASAGKTRLVLAGMVALGRHLGAVGGTLRAADDDSASRLTSAEEIVRDGKRTTKTDATLPASLTVRLGAGKRKAHLHLFDAAGELYADRTEASTLTFLDDVQGMVFVLDPFSIRAVASALRGPLTERVAEAEPAREEPAGSYRVTVQWMRDSQIDLTRCSLAVAVVKADLLLGLPPAEGLESGSGSDAVRRWLCDHGVDDLVNEAKGDFGEVSYHLVSSWDAGTDDRGVAGPLSPARPLLWVLGRSGFAVPEPAVTS